MQVIIGYVQQYNKKRIMHNHIKQQTTNYLNIAFR